jgi:hypothetical protein
MKQSYYRGVLAYSGLLPWVALLGLMLWQHSTVWLGVQWLTWVSSYTLCIVCFMAGTHWGQAVHLRARGSWLWFSSNIILLAAWAAYNACSESAFFWVSAVLLLLLWAVDHRQQQLGAIAPDYALLRTRISCVAIPLLIALGCF